MAITTIDPLAIVYEHLTASGTELNSRVGTNVFHHIAAEDWDPFGTTGAVIYSIEAGSVSFYTPMETTPVRFLCYGGADANKNATRAKAWDVYRSLRDVLHGKNMIAVTSGTIMRAECVLTGQSLFDDDLQVPYVGTRFDLDLRPTS